MDDRTVDPPAHDRHPPRPDASAAPPDGAPSIGAPVEGEQRPLGALAITAFLVVTILVLWFGMFFLNVVRN